MFSCVLSCEEDTALSIIDPTSALVELNNARRQKGRKNAGLLDFAEEQLPSLEVSSGKFFYSLQVGERRMLQCDYSNRGTWKKIIQSRRFFWKQKILKFICKRTNDIQGSTINRELWSHEGVIIYSSLLNIPQDTYPI